MMIKCCLLARTFRAATSAHKGECLPTGPEHSHVPVKYTWYWQVGLGQLQPL